MKVLAIVPAHNEAASIAETIKSLLSQTHAPDEIVVIPNNTTDNTGAICRALGVTVYDVGKCEGRKAGALNLGLDRYLPDLDDDDLILAMDADTVLTPNLIANAAQHFIDDPMLGGLSSNHLVMHHGNLLELLQAMEYERDRVMIGRHKGRGGCITGMAALFRVAALREMKETYGTVYDAENWTEDWKLTIALRHSRWHTLRPQDCMVSTVPVSEVHSLFKQRERWARGYLQTLMQFGWTRKTGLLWIKQGGFLFSIVIRLLYFVMIGVMFTMPHPSLVSWWMLPVILVFSIDNVLSVKGAGKLAMLVSVIFPVEIAYAWLLTVAIGSGYIKQLTGLGAKDTWVSVRG